MRAIAVDDEPLVMAVFDARLIRLRVDQGLERRRARFCDLLLGPVADEDQFSAPEDLDDLALRDRREIELDRRAGGDRFGIGRERSDERPRRRARTNRSSRARCDKEEVTPGRLSSCKRKYIGHSIELVLQCWAKSSGRWPQGRKQFQGRVAD